jgi:hypothetical protein
LVGQQYFGKAKLFCGVESILIACAMNLLEEEKKVEEEGNRKRRMRR